LSATVHHAMGETTNEGKRLSPMVTDYSEIAQ
jgi:hypothetical protein